MRCYSLRQYTHDQPCHAAADVTGILNDLKKAQVFTAMRLREFNEIIDQNRWKVVWRFNKVASAGSMTSGATSRHATL